MPWGVELLTAVLSLCAATMLPSQPGLPLSQDLETKGEFAADTATCVKADECMRIKISLPLGLLSMTKMIPTCPNGSVSFPP